MEKSRLQKLYQEQWRNQLKADLRLSNVMDVPKIVKIVLNIGAGKDAISNSKILQSHADTLSKIAGQRAVKTVARKSIAGFKLREGMAIGTKVTLRGQRMYEFLDRLINVGLPKVRDFQGVPSKFDGRGGYNLGIKDLSIFPEVSYGEAGDKTVGLNVTILTSARVDEHGVALLKCFGMPFRKK